MPGRPYVLLSAAMSVDGSIDDAGPGRLVLSDAVDLDRVDEARAGVDAILVGAGTIRSDDPRLLIRSPERRIARGGTDPVKVTLTRTGDLDPTAQFFTTGDALRLVYAETAGVERARARVGGAATVVDAGPTLDPAWLLADLRGRGVGRLMIEGGTHVHALFLGAGLVDELQLLVAPFFVGDAAAPRFGGAGKRRMRLAEVRPIGDQVLLRYTFEDGLSMNDRDLLAAAVELGRRCPPSTTAFSVGALLTDAAGAVLADGWSRRDDPHDHAEEAALATRGAGWRAPPGATMYTSLEPCSARASRPRTCTELILAAGIDRVVFAWREPSIFVDCEGAELLRAAGVEVVELPELADGVREVNRHLLAT